MRVTPCSALALVVLALAGCVGGERQRPPDDVPSTIEPLRMRAPAVPLMVAGPSWSLWSTTDHPADSWPIHWNGAPRHLLATLLVDGVPWRLLGPEPTQAQPMPLVATEIWPMSTVYRFQQGRLETVVRFADAGDGLPRSSMQVSCTFDDRTVHHIALLVEAGGQLARADASAPVDLERQESVWRSYYGLTATAAAGTERLYREDGELPDWGSLEIQLPSNGGGTLLAGPSAPLRESFLAARAPSGDLELPARAVAQDIVLVFEETVLGSEATFELRLGHRRDKVVSFGGEDCVLTESEGDYDRFANVDLTNRTTVSSADGFGSSAYHDLVILATRQALGAVERCYVGDRKYAFMKELASGSLIQTVDVIFPAAPAYSNELLGELLAPFFDYLERGTWKAAWPPHDLGIYPVVGDDPHFADTPVETAGDLLLLAALHARRGGRSLAAGHEALLKQWADYLASVGADPPLQLSTDDFTGATDHNATLGLKVALAVSAFANIEQVLGHDELARQYSAKGRALCQDFVAAAWTGEHFVHRIGDTESFGLKYNLLFDRLLGLQCIDPSFVAREIRWYRAHALPEGVPLDSRFSFVKVDWLAWMAALGTKEDLDDLLYPVARHLAETDERVPFTDLYDGQSGKRPWPFQARPVVGALFAPILLGNMP